MSEKEIRQLEQACIILAQAIEDGRIDGVEKEVLELLGYIKKVK